MRGEPSRLNSCCNRPRCMSPLKKLVLIVIAFAIVLPVARYLGRRDGEDAARRKITSVADGQKEKSRPYFASTASEQNFLWQPSGCEYSVTFPEKPKISESLSTIDGIQVTIQVATHTADKGWEQVSFVPYTRTAVTTKSEAYTNMTSYAKAFGMDHFDIQFDDSNSDDILAIIKGTKMVKTQYGDVVMSFLGQVHWGRRSVFGVLICAPADDHPTKVGMACFKSVNQHL